MGCWSVGVLNSPLRCLPSIHYSITPIVQFCCCCGGTHEASVFYNGTMQVGILPAAPLPGGVKVARRPVKPLVLVRVQVWQPIWKAGRYKLAAPVSKTGSASPRSEHYRRLPPFPIVAVRKHRLVAQKQSIRPISGRPRSVTARDDHFQNINQRKSNEARSSFSKPIALSQELQTGSFDPNPTGRQDDQGFSSHA